MGSYMGNSDIDTSEGGNYGLYGFSLAGFVLVLLCMGCDLPLYGSQTRGCRNNARQAHTQ
jgi:hypothetical protein